MVVRVGVVLEVVRFQKVGEVVVKVVVWFGSASVHSPPWHTANGYERPGGKEAFAVLSPDDCGIKRMN